MLLRDWMQKEGITQVDLGKILGIAGSSISNATIGRQSVGKDLALKLVEITKGIVSFEEAMFPGDYIERGKNGSIQTRSVPKRKPLLSNDKFELLDKIKNKKIRRPSQSRCSRSEFMENLNNIRIEFRSTTEFLKQEIRALKAKVDK